jgi:hypothetical protein
MHYNRGKGACPNTLLIARRTLEEHLLGGLQEKVLNPNAIAYTLDAFEKQLLAAVNRRGNQSALLQRRVETIQKQIRNCTDAIAEGKRYPSLMEKLAELERDLADAKAKIAHSEPRAVKLQMRDARQFVEARLRNLRSVLAGESRIARAEIVKHVRKITLTPEGRAYIASGTWDLLGTENHGWCRGPGVDRTSTRSI